MEGVMIDHIKLATWLGIVVLCILTWVVMVVTPLTFVVM
jgi:hypothetical protein